MAKTKEKPIPPYIRARTRGRYGTLLNRVESAFREENPGKEIYWAFDPEQSQELSQVPTRQIMGYEVVDCEKHEYLKEILPNAGTKVRIGDLTLCAIDAEDKEMILEQKRMTAEADANRSERSFQEEIRREAGGKNLMTPVGNISTKSESIQPPEIEED